MSEQSKLDPILALETLGAIGDGTVDERDFDIPMLATFSFKEIERLTKERDLYKGQAEINQRTIKDMAAGDREGYDANGSPVSDVSGVDVNRYIRALKEPAAAFKYCHQDTISDLTAMLSELLQKREDVVRYNNGRVILLNEIEALKKKLDSEYRRSEAESVKLGEAQGELARIHLENDAIKKKLSAAQETMRDLWRLEGQCTAELAQRVKELIGGG